MIVMATFLVSTLQVGMPAAHAGSKATASYYVALGDSLAAGFQPNMGGRLSDGLRRALFRPSGKRSQESAARTWPAPARRLPH